MIENRFDYAQNLYLLRAEEDQFLLDFASRTFLHSLDPERISAFWLRAPTTGRVRSGILPEQHHWTVALSVGDQSDGTTPRLTSGRDRDVVPREIGLRRFGLTTSDGK